MSHYCIGDVQGCLEPLQRLLEKIRFNPKKDVLWFTGDLVNRGPQSLEVLRFVKNLENAVVVLGNHDFHLLAEAEGLGEPTREDTLQDVLTAPDCKNLCEWLRHQPLVHHDEKLGYTLVHAGFPPTWNLTQALALSKEVEIVLQSADYKLLLQNLYGDTPHRWTPELKGVERWRIIINTLTRIRFCDAEGNLELMTKGDAHTPPPGLLPWFQWSNRLMKSEKILFGHWAALEGKTDVADVFALDTGCVWGRTLTAMRLEDQERFSVSNSQRSFPSPCKGEG